MNNHSCAEQVCPAKYLHAQQGCGHCLEELLCAHERLVGMVVSRQWCGCVAWVDLEQEGRIALWQAILGYDVEQGTAFSSYAVVAIERRIWREVREGERCRDLAFCWEETQAPAASVVWEYEEQQRQVAELVERLPQRLQSVIVQAYGFGREPALSLAAIGRRWGLSRERIRELRNDALVHLRLQVLAGAEIGIRLDRQRYRHRIASR